MDRFLYVCPQCGLGSWTMEVSEDLTYFPNPADLESRPSFMFIPIQHEVLLCQCGAINNWFTLIEIKAVGTTGNLPNG